jgi:hypothetical protein
VTRGGVIPPPVVWPAVAPIIGGVGLYAACQWIFATLGHGTPGPWDTPRRFVAVRPYRWVRNPIYIAALLMIVGEARLFLSLALLVYAVPVAVGVHLFVLLYEERTLHRPFGVEYDLYRSRVWRWIPRPQGSTGPLSISLGTRLAWIPAMLPGSSCQSVEPTRGSDAGKHDRPRAAHGTATRRREA